MHFYKADIQNLLDGFSSEILKAVFLRLRGIGKETSSIRIEKIVGSSAYHIFLMEGIIRRNLATFSLDDLPGCCGVCVSYHASTEQEFRKCGIGRIINRFRLALAKALGYGQIVCTVISTHHEQIQILKENGWNETFGFTNPKTKNSILFFRKDLV